MAASVYVHVCVCVSWCLTSGVVDSFSFIDVERQGEGVLSTWTQCMAIAQSYGITH